MPSRLYISCVLAVGVVVATAQAACAGGWEFSPRLTTSELYTDNVNLTRSDRESDFITTISPGFSLERTGAARTRLSVDFEVERVLYLEEKERDETRENLEADAGIELFEDFFFIDALASMSQATVSQSGVESGTGVTDEANRTQLLAVTLNPNVRHRLGNWAAVRGDYILSNVRTETDDIENTVGETVSATITSGREFAFLKWTADLSAGETEFSESDRVDRRKLAQIELQYVDRILFQPIASVGYEKFEDSTLIDPPDGLIWAVGGLIQPGPRTSVRVTHGRRFDDPNTSLEAQYDISSRTRLNASVEQVLETSQGLQVQQLGNQQLPQAPLVTSSDGFSLTNNTFRQTDASISLDAERGRNTFRAEAQWSERKTDATGEDSTVQTFTAQWDRRLSRFLTGALNASYRTTRTKNLGSTVDDDFVTFGIAFDYRLAADWQAGLDYTGTVRTSSGEGEEYTENAFTFTLVATF